MKKILSIIFLLCANYVLGQDTTSTKKDSVASDGHIFSVVEKMPEFPGGQTELFKYLGKNIKYPKKARRKGVTGRVYITFVVNKAGNVIDTRIVRGVSKEIDAEAFRVVSQMPDWIPGFLDGKCVNVQYNLPINFTLK